MAVIDNGVYEDGVFENGRVFADFTSVYVDRLDIIQKIIFLKTDISTFHPIDDIYPEIRAIRRIDESIRVKDNPVSPQGNNPAGANFTPRRIVLNDGWRFGIENVTNGEISFTGEMISDDGFAGAQLVELGYLPSGVSMLVNYTPPSSEVIKTTTVTTVVTGDIADVPTAAENADAVWSDQRAVDVIEEIHYIERAVHIDPEAITQGIGTQSNPFNTVEAALDFAELNNLKLLHVLSDVTVDRNLKNFVIIGIGTPTVDCNGHNLDRSEFFHCRMKGNYIGKVLVQQSILLNNFQLNGIFEKCPIEGVVDMIGDSLIVGCYSYVGGLGYPVLKISAGEAVFRDYHGSIGVADCTGGSHSIGVASGGRVIVENTNIGGNIHVRGFPFDIIDSSGAGCSVLDETDSKRVRELPSKVWDEVL